MSFGLKKRCKLRIQGLTMSVAEIQSSISQAIVGGGSASPGLGGDGTTAVELSTSKFPFVRLVVRL